MARNTRTPGTSATSGTPATSATLAPQQRRVKRPPNRRPPLPLSHEDAIQSPVKDSGDFDCGVILHRRRGARRLFRPRAVRRCHRRFPRLQCSSEAAARSSTDAPESASTVTPVDRRTAQQRDAAEARSAAAASVAKQEAAVHERDARTTRGRDAASSIPLPRRLRSLLQPRGAAPLTSRTDRRRTGSPRPTKSSTPRPPRRPPRVPPARRRRVSARRPISARPIRRRRMHCRLRRRAI